MINSVVIGKLKIGVDLRERIVEMAKKEGVKSGVFLSGLGALEKAVFQNAKMIPPDYKMDDKHRSYVEINHPLTLLSLSGWIATKKDGEIEVHPHFTASTVIDGKIVTLGGHLTKGTITSISCVMIIGLIDDPKIFAAKDQTELCW